MILSFINLNSQSKMDEESPKERTKRMHRLERIKLIEHEKASRSNEGKPQFSLKTKLKVTLPLVAVVIALYSASFSYTQWKRKILSERIGDKQVAILQDVREIYSQEEVATFEDQKELDPEFITDNPNKKW